MGTYLGIIIYITAAHITNAGSVWAVVTYI